MPLPLAYSANESRERTCTPLSEMVAQMVAHQTAEQGERGLYSRSLMRVTGE